ncbi:TetR family transcriptional regulator [Sulfitobacter sp. BDSS02]|jgi:AcrR family transcriptional regulator|uniref:TetR/AcrR family transcriptional regulator n=2 Tax=Rhodobacterales TaxID=204455 RepID=A0A5B8FJG6_9RHOB|nr:MULTISPECIES: TetR/AcrR family transcriptional regulator [Rhodobacterales]MBB3987910.1 TetR/AcrR family transcriptional repressor of lmrAB and yxaGH operons [Sagittula marina]MBL3705986.1 TetR family transcriptional regulator [Sulfitobacter sp. BDSS02]MBR9852597.1 TetR/AcrR family transcriptional regulator [Paracoccaceae bacterium]QDL94851.1 TetR/AcrR family transcriptional regulator [Paroceanicella profunda]
MSDPTSRDRLIRAASNLFRQKGYSGVGLSEILKEAGLPKGSLYYHFPKGKQELAEAATRWAGAWLERLLDATFAQAESFDQGALMVCETISAEVASQTHVSACPVLSILQAAPLEPQLQITAQDVYGSWTKCIEKHAKRMGSPQPEEAAFSLHCKLQGAWVIAFAQQSNAAFTQLARELRAKI